MINKILKIDAKDRPSIESLVNDEWMMVFAKEFGINLKSCLSAKKVKKNKTKLTREEKLKEKQEQ